MRQIHLDATLAAKILEIARESAIAIMHIYEEMLIKGGDVKDVLVAHKNDSSPLTLADLQAHQIISKGLAALAPGVPVVSEEDSQSMDCRSPIGDFWLIDPLDGTKEFLAQDGEFTVNIALIRDGKAILGVIVAPALAQAYWGGDGLGAFREMDRRRETIHVAKRVGLGQPVRVLASKNHMNAETIEFISRLGTYELLQAGSSLKFCRLAEGAADVYPRLGPTCEWDTAAAQAIVEAAGGCVSKLDGTPLSYGKQDILNPHFVASSTPLHDLS